MLTVILLTLRQSFPCHLLLTLDRRRLILIIFAVKDTISVHTPVVTGLGEGPRRYTRSLIGVLKFGTDMWDTLPSPICHTLE